MAPSAPPSIQGSVHDSPRDDTGPRSPTSPGRSDCGDANLKLQCQQFVDEWHYRILHSSLAKKWNRQTSLQVMATVFEINGATIQPADRDRLHLLDESELVNRLMDAMPLEMKDEFDAFAFGIQSAISTAARVRRSIDMNQPEVLQEILDNPSTSDVSERIMSQAVCSASREVQNIRGTHASWRLNSEQRMVRLGKNLGEAEHARQQLMAVEAQLESFGVSQKGKSKAVLVGMAEGKEKTLKHTVYSSWLGYVLKCRTEKAIRAKFEAEIHAAEDKLIQYQEKQLKNVTNVLMRKAGESTGCLLHLCVETWQEAIAEFKKEGETAEKMREAQAKLDGYSAAQKQNTKAVMSRMAAGNDEALVTLVWQAWQQFITEYKKDKDMEDAVKQAEKKVQDFLKEKSESAKGVLDSMGSGSDAGLISMILRYWIQYFQDEKKEKEMLDIFNAQQEKFASMNARQAGNARGVQNRAIDLMNANLQIRLLAAWRLECCTAKMTRDYKNKLTQKKEKLHGIQGMMHTFARDMESSTMGSPDDSSGRRSDRKSRKSHSVGGPQRSPHSGKSSKAEALPDINQKTAQVY